MPVHCTVFLNVSAWAMAFCPVVASSTSSTSCGAPAICLLTTRWIFSSSRIRCVCVCSRPAVSTISTSKPRALALSQASWATLAGSLPCSFLTISQPMPLLQMVSCSTAAARKVSQAATITFLPSSWKRLASLAMRGRLAGAVDAGHQDDRRPGRVPVQADPLGGEQCP